MGCQVNRKLPEEIRALIGPPVSADLNLGKVCETTVLTRQSTSHWEERNHVAKGPASLSEKWLSVVPKGQGKAGKEPLDPSQHFAILIFFSKIKQVECLELTSPFSPGDSETHSPDDIRMWMSWVTAQQSHLTWHFVLLSFPKPVALFMKVVGQHSLRRQQIKNNPKLSKRLQNLWSQNLFSVFYSVLLPQTIISPQRSLMQS